MFKFKWTSGIGRSSSFYQTIIQEVRAKFPDDNERISRMSIVEENGN